MTHRRGRARPRLTVLDSGVRVVTERMPSVRSVALGFWIGTGSAAEAEPEAGLVAPDRAHALPRHRALRVAGDRPDLRRDGRRAERRHRQGDDVGLLARARPPPRARLRRHGRHGLAPALRRSTISSSEREIVLEEIAMYEDDPQDQVFDVLGEAVFGDHPLGRAIIGRADVVGAAGPRCPARPSTPRATSPTNVVVAAAGSVDHDALVELVERAGIERAGGRAPALPAGARRPARAPALLRQGDRAVPRVPRRARASRATTSAASRCACSTTSSAGRRPRGCSRRCARSAAWPTASTRSSRCYAGTGQIGLYLGTRPDNVARALQVVGRRARALPRRARHRRRARALQGERQGPHACCRSSRRRRA